MTASAQSIPTGSDRTEKPLKIAIFGCGYLGSRFAKMAIGQGHEVSALTRNAEKAAALRDMGLKQVVEGQLHEDSWHNEFGGGHYDLVINCVSSGGSGMEGYRLSYLEGTRSILRWSSKGHGIGHLLYTGATSVYPQVYGELVTEADVPATLTESGALLVEAENIVRDEAGCVDRRTVLRLGGIYGPKRHYILKCLRAGQKVFPGSGDFIINHIHVDDVIGAIWAAHNHAAPEFSLYNVVDGTFPTKRDVTCWLAQLQGIDPQTLVFDTDEMTARAARRQVPGMPEGVMPNRRVSNAAIVRELGWRPQYPSFHEGYMQILREDEMLEGLPNGVGQ